jgi:hypothetical protein
LDARSVKVLCLRAESIIVDLEITPHARCNGRDLHQALVEQTKDSSSALMSGKYTSKTLAISPPRTMQDGSFPASVARGKTPDMDWGEGEKRRTAATAAEAVSHTDADPDTQKKMSRSFEVATDWKGFSRRFDFSLQGVIASRLPTLFFVHNGKLPESPDFKSVTVCSVHLAYGQVSKSETRCLQLQNLASLMAGPRCDRSKCLYALVGDFNSNASVATRGLDFRTSDEGTKVMEQINEHSLGHVLALVAGEKTSIGGEWFDEVIVHQSTLGRRHSHVFPTLDLVQPQMRRALPEAEQKQYKTVTMGFGNIFTDHLLLYVDLQFSACIAGEMGEAGARAAADWAKEAEEAATVRDTYERRRLRVRRSTKRVRLRLRRCVRRGSRTEGRV